MRIRIVLLLCLVLLCSSCAAVREFFATKEGQAVADKGTAALGKLLSGDAAGAIGQSLDIIWILLGFKAVNAGAKKVAKVAKARVLNPRAPLVDAEGNLTAAGRSEGAV